jgi:uncharacterized membrane-anchored protein YitT (DUF2179 family)
MGNLSQPVSESAGKPAGNINWQTVRDYALILLGALIQAFSMRLFLVPAQMVSGGISGAAQIINSYVNWPIGLMVFIGNLPLFFLGWRYLGRVRFALRTAVAIAAFSLFTDLLVFFIPPEGVTSDMVLNCLYGGITLGIGLGLVYLGKGTSGGSDILGRILNRKLGIPITQAYLITDALVVLASGFSFGWPQALYGLVVIYVSGVAAEMVSEGTGIFRSVMIVTSQPDQVRDVILTNMERGVTILAGKGGYTGTDKPVLYCVVTRAEVNQLKEMVSEIDPAAFMVIGQAHEALGEGFKSFEKDK